MLPRWTPSASTPTNVFGCGIGWAGATRCGRRSVCRSRSPSARRTSRRCSPVRTRWIDISARRPSARTCLCGWRCSGCGTSTLSGCRRSRCCPMTRGSPVFRRSCSSSTWRATASGSRATALQSHMALRRWSGASPATRRSIRSSRCCTRGNPVRRSTCWSGCSHRVAVRIIKHWRSPTPSRRRRLSCTADAARASRPIRSTRVTDRCRCCCSIGWTRPRSALWSRSTSTRCTRRA